MSLYPVFRLSAVVMTIVALQSIPNRDIYYAIVGSMGFAHYGLSLWFARNSLRRVATQLHSVIPVALLFAIGFGFFLIPWTYFGDLPLKFIVYFGLHHVFNEIYIGSRARPTQPGSGGQLLFARIAFNLALYTMLVINDNELRFLDRNLVLVGCLAAGGLWLGLLAGSRRKLDRGETWEVLSLEAFSVVLAIGTYFEWLYIRYLDVVLYHFLFWALYPLPQLARSGGRAAVGGYLGWHAALFAVFLLMAPLSGVPYGDGKSELPVFIQQFFLWSVIHITVSFAVSRAQPGWITRAFVPRDRAVPV